AGPGGGAPTSTVVGGAGGGPADGGAGQGAMGAQAGGGSLPTPTCGNGDVEPPEDCDDGNLQPADGCSAACTVEDRDNCRAAPVIPVGSTVVSITGNTTDASD